MPEMDGLEATQSNKFKRRSHYENDFCVSSTDGDGNTKNVFLKVRQRRTFKKTTFTMRIAGRSKNGDASSHNAVYKGA